MQDSESPAQAIRSVTHLDLADGSALLLPQIRTERSGAAAQPEPSSLRPVFEVRELVGGELDFVKPARPPPSAQLTDWRVPKTFSAGPCSFSIQRALVRKSHTSLSRPTRN